MRKRIGVPAIATVLVAAGVAAFSDGVRLPNLVPFVNEAGAASTFSTTGAIDLSGPFFQDLGSNGRSCGTCHQPGDGWTIVPSHVQARFAASQGLDPIFRPVDGANCPSADFSTVEARQQNYSMLLNKGLIRVSIGVPSNADFAVTGISDPHNCADTKASSLALFRRPLSSSNLPFLTTIMWDGREPSLAHQAMDATLGHAEAAHAPSDVDVAQIVLMENTAFLAQSDDRIAGDLGARGARGGALALSQQQFYRGINDPLGGNPTGATFDPVVFTLYDKWANDSGRSTAAAARRSIARGEELFNTLQFDITGVAGLNDLPGLATLRGTCTTCHDSPNVGNHSVPLAINIGVTDYPARTGLDIAGLPVYTITCNSGETLQTTDPGRALITGKCADVGKTKGPVLRGLSARAPYFHNGSAASLHDVVTFYNERFSIHLTEQQKDDLVAFLGAL